MIKKMKRVFLMMAVSCLLAGCRMAALPGQEPFGEQTYSAGEAQAVYESVLAEMGQIGFSDWSGYSMELSENTVSHDFYHTEEYTVAWHEGAGRDYLWYMGRLYCSDGASVSYRDTAWEELSADDYAARQWGFALRLLEQEPEKMEYKYIPMASDGQYLLTVRYPETAWEGQDRRFPQMRFRLDGDNRFSGFSLHWQEGSWRVIDISYFPYEGSVSLQAERKVWGFAHELGLTGEGVPALSDQEDDRERCRSAVSGMDFEGLAGRSAYQENLAFPVPPEQDNDADASGSHSGEEGR